jgi:NAD(P)-dependent dehydrogenase (short-subunit alcohol dehydrogenase family)
MMEQGSDPVHSEARMDQKLAGKVAIVTGAARGQGAAEARLLAAAGASVVVADVLDGPGEALAAETRKSGGKAEFRHLDVAQEAPWADLVSHVRKAHGALHILVNNAGVALRVPSMLDTRLEDWNRLVSINLTGAFLGIRACAPLIRDSGGGAIVNTGSIAGMTGHFATAYSSTKWGIRGLTKSAAMEFAPWKIRVNAVHPGIVLTDMVGESADFVEAMTWMTPLSRAATAEDIAKVVLFLVSDDSGYVTGHDIPVDGGFTDAGAYRQVLLRVMNKNTRTL